MERFWNTGSQPTKGLQPTLDEIIAIAQKSMSSSKASESDLRLFKHILTQRLSEINSANRIELSEQIGYRAADLAGQSMSNQQQMRMFAALIISSMRQDALDDLHPSFLDIIPQLSELDCFLFSYLRAPFAYALRASYQTHGHTIVKYPYVLDLDEGELNSIDLKYMGISVENLLRLHLIEKGNMRSVSYEELSQYPGFSNQPVIMNFPKKYFTDYFPDGERAFTLIFLHTTTYGESFARCVLD